MHINNLEKERNLNKLNSFIDSKLAKIKIQKTIRKTYKDQIKNSNKIINELKKENKKNNKNMKDLNSQN